MTKFLLGVAIGYICHDAIAKLVQQANVAADNVDKADHHIKPDVAS